jgi:alkylation response protein AidB-like acyl-CoA dehydrogenase
MDVRGSEAARLLAETAAELLERTWTLREVRNVAAGTRPLAEVWQDVVELGWLAALVPADMGGAELPLVDVVDLALQLGAGLLPAPVLEVMAGSLPSLAAAGQHDLVNRTLQGTAVPLPAERFVPYGALATHLVLGDGTAVACGALPDAGSLDLTTPIGQAALAEKPQCQPAALLVLRAAGAVGSATRLLAMTVAHARTRHQFGQPIGAFQALKHRLADVAWLVERARVNSYHAAWVVDGGAPTSYPHPVVASISIARATALQAFEAASSAALQIHGGISFTWDHDVHLYVRRCRWLASQWGGVGGLLESVVDTLSEEGA